MPTRLQLLKTLVHKMQLPQKMLLLPLHKKHLPHLLLPKHLQNKQ